MLRNFGSSQEFVGRNEVSCNRNRKRIPARARERSRA